MQDDPRSETKAHDGRLQSDGAPGYTDVILLGVPKTESIIIHYVAESARCCRGWGQGFLERSYHRI